jgi:hypothetical protein
MCLFTEKTPLVKAVVRRVGEVGILRQRPRVHQLPVGGALLGVYDCVGALYGGRALGVEEGVAVQVHRVLIRLALHSVVPQESAHGTHNAHQESGFRFKGTGSPDGSGF